MATSGVDAVTLDPWHEPGIPLDEQYRSWKQRIKAPTTKLEVDAYTRTRMVEQQQQTTINWLHPADQSVLEELDEFDHYLTARWQLSTTLGPVLVRSTIEREPWPLHRAVAHELATDLVAAPTRPQGSRWCTGLPGCGPGSAPCARSDEPDRLALMRARPARGFALRLSVYSPVGLLKPDA